MIFAQLVAEEEKLRLEEEAAFAAQREAARLAKERKLKEVRRSRWARPALLLTPPTYLQPHPSHLWHAFSSNL